jgi:tetratricopeptide (TPR) repeat protein
MGELMKFVRIVIVILVIIEIFIVILYFQKKARQAHPVATATSTSTVVFSPSPESSTPVALTTQSPMTSIVPAPTSSPTRPLTLASPEEPQDSLKVGSFAKGLNHFKHMDYDKAITDFNEIAAKNPKNLWAHYYLFRSYVEIEDKAFFKGSNAYKEAKTVLQLSPDAEMVKNINDYMDTVKEREALAAGTASPSPLATANASPIAETPSAPPSLGPSTGVPIITAKDAELHLERGKNYDRIGNSNFAIAEYSNAIKINPRLTEAYISRGSLYETKGELGSAAGDYSKAIEQRPADAKNYYRRGKVYKNLKDNEKAKADLIKVKELDPSMADKVDAMLKDLQGP